MSKTVTLKIEGMRCKGCAMGTQGALEKVAGVESTKVSFPDKQAVVVCADAVDEGAPGQGFFQLLFIFFKVVAVRVVLFYAVHQPVVVIFEKHERVFF